MNQLLIFGLGFLAQFLFFGRTFIQWVKSESESRATSPSAYWKISIAASLLMMIYAVLRHDFAILLGQVIVYYIYIRNLQLKNVWPDIHRYQRILLLITPIAGAFWLLPGGEYGFRTMVGNGEIARWLLLMGVAGQLTFTFRFVYQWILSERGKESVLPSGFWIISISGAMIIIIYGLFRRDPVLIISNGLGLFVYIRNLLIISGGKSLFDQIEKPWFREFARKISQRIR